MNTEEYISKLFQDAGWYEERDVELQEIRDIECEAHSEALKILKEFGGLIVGENSAGRECSASKISFYPRPRYEADGMCKKWESSFGKLVAIASAHESHIMILVNPQGFLYIFTIPDSQLYYGGSFEDTTKKLLIGLDYGAAIATS